MIGPNCMGVINTDPEVRLNGTFAPVPARAGSIGFVSQSGALGVAILNVAQELGVGLTQFVSMGNKADVSGNDLLEYWEEDERTRVIAMYLESFGNPRHFTEIAKRVGRKKPILVVKSGRTSEGARAASSHTGAIAGTDVTVSAFLDQCGVVRANTIEELFDLAVALDRCPLAKGNRVAIVTNAGGPAIMATDACVNMGLRMADLTEETRETLRGFLPPAASVANPVDMIASATPEQYARSLRTVLADPNVDLAMVINVTPLMSDPSDVLREVAAVAADGGVPVLAVMMASEDFYEEIKGREDLPPVYRFPEPAARVLSQLVRYGAWRRRPADEAPPEFEVDDAAVAAILESHDPEEGEGLPAAGRGVPGAGALRHPGGAAGGMHRITPQLPEPGPTPRGGKGAPAPPLSSSARYSWPASSPTRWWSRPTVRRSSTRATWARWRWGSRTKPPCAGRWRTWRSAWTKPTWRSRASWCRRWPPRGTR